MVEMDWWRLLGDQWDCCDNIFEHGHWLRPALGAASVEQLAAMMTDGELASLATMPDQMVVYRGCYAANKDGLSWTTKRVIAERFPFLHRYRQPGQALLVRGVVPRSHSVLKLQREEFEVVSAYVEITSATPLPPHTNQRTELSGL